jgi:hypothetical protein
MTKTRLRCGFNMIINFAFIVLLQTSVGCVDREPLPEWLNNWLENPSCQPPCWEQIIPGSSSIEYAISVLRDTPEFRIYNFSTPHPTDQITMEWRIPGSSDSGFIASGKGSESDIVQVIMLNLNSDLSIEHVLDTYGPPNYVETVRCRTEFFSSSCEVNLVYRDLGLVIGLLVGTTYRLDEIIIRKNLTIDRLVFLSPSSQTITQEGCLSCTEWKGYGVYKIEGL